MLQEHFTLKQVADSIQKSIAERYGRTYWVVAEMYRLNQTNKGHCYPELVHRENEEIVVQMKGTIWKTSFLNIKHKFETVLGEPLSDGMKLLFEVKVTFSGVYGLTLEVLDIDPNYTLGSLQKERNETIERLTKENLIAANQKIEMNFLPKRIAIISQNGTKGYADFITILDQHTGLLKFDYLLFEASVNGDVAIQSITNQLNRIRKVKDHFDLVVLVRGGGAEVGMHCFNNYSLCKTLCEFPLPIITGIGHSTNLTVSEIVAFHNGITPTDTANYLIKIALEIESDLNETQQTLPKITRQISEQKNALLTESAKAFQFNTSKLMFKFTDELNGRTNNFQTVSTNYNNKKNQILQSLSENIAFSFKAKITSEKTTQNSSVIQLENCMSRNLLDYSSLLENTQLILEKEQHTVIGKRKNLLENLEKTVRLLDPKNVLQRGYSIVTNEKGVVSLKNEAKINETLFIRTAEQEIETTVQKIIMK